MSLPELFQQLKLDVWYKALVYLGGVLVILSLFFEVKGITNLQLLLLSVGVFFFGLGEWQNHRKQSYIKPPNAYTGPTTILNVTVRKPTFFGCIFDALGIALIIYGIWLIISAS